jgi:hypothetical protein
MHFHPTQMQGLREPLKTFFLNFFICYAVKIIKKSKSLQLGREVTKWKKVFSHSKQLNDLRHTTKEP